MPEEGDGSGDRKEVEEYFTNNPRSAELGGNVLIARNVKKAYEMNGGKETVVALRDLNLVEGSEFYPVKEYVNAVPPSPGCRPFVMRTPSEHLPRISFRLCDCLPPLALH